MIRLTTPRNVLNIGDGESCLEVLGQSLSLIVWKIVVLDKNYVNWLIMLLLIKPSIWGCL